MEVNVFAMEIQRGQMKYFLDVKEGLHLSKALYAPVAEPGLM